LIDLRGLDSIRRESPGEFAVAVTTTAVVIVVGVVQGIVLAMVMSLLRIVHHTYQPHTGVLVSDSGQYWQLIPPSRGATTEPGLTIYRFSAPLFYANAGRFAKEIETVVGPAPSPVRWLVVDAEAITNVDYTAARAVLRLHRELASIGVALAFARVQEYLQADFDRHHITDVIGKTMIFHRLHDALDAFAKLAASPAERSAPKWPPV
jgi:MFS superfamily sulfate permease-like transporter